MNWYRQLMQWNGSSWVLVSGRRVSMLEDRTAELQAQAKRTRSWLLERFFYAEGGRWVLDHSWQYPANGTHPMFRSY